MYCRQGKRACVISYMTSDMLIIALSCFVLLSSTPQCKANDDFFSAYEREYEIDWEHGFQEGLGEVEIDGKWGFINSAGEIVIKPKFNQVFGFHEGIATARSGAIWSKRKAAFLGLAGQWIHINKKGDPAYRKSNFHVSLDGFSEGLAVVWLAKKKSTGFLTYTVEEKWGFINTKGEIVIPIKYRDVRFPFSEGLAGFKDPNLKCGYINHAGEVVIEPRYSWALPFSDGMAPVGIFDRDSKQAKWGFIDYRGEEVIPLQYVRVKNYSEGLVAVKKNGKWGYIDKSGHTVIPFKFDDADPFSESYAAVVVERKVGYIDHSGGYVIEPQFEGFDVYGEVPTRRWLTYVPRASSFSEGVAAVMKGGKWGYIDKKGNVVIGPKFGQVSPFTEGFAKVAVGDKLGYIDKQGKYIWEPTR